MLHLIQSFAFIVLATVPQSGTSSDVQAAYVIRVMFDGRPFDDQPLPVIVNANGKAAVQRLKQVQYTRCDQGRRSVQNYPQGWSTEIEADPGKQTHVRLDAIEVLGTEIQLATECYADRPPLREAHADAYIDLPVGGEKVVPAQEGFVFTIERIR